MALFVTEHFCRAVEGFIMTEVKAQLELSNKSIVKKGTLFLSVALLVTVVSICQAQNAERTRPEADLSVAPIIKCVQDLWGLFDPYFGTGAVKGNIGVDLSTTIVSKHMWHGFDLLDDHGAVIPSATVTFGDTGFSGKVIGVYPLSSGFEKSVELNYAAFYKGSFLEDTRYVSDFTVNYFYYGKPKVARRKADTQEIGVSLCWPELINVGGSSVVPSYYFGSIWPSKSDSDNSGCEGFIHAFGLGYDLSIPDFWQDKKEQIFSFFGNITYNDGFGGAAVDSDWSHAVIGVRTNLGRGNLTIAPGLYYQISMDDSVNDEDELWCGLTLTYSF